MGLLVDLELVNAVGYESNLSTCADSPFHFFFKSGVKLINANCEWISRDKETNCKLDGVDTICPSTCSACDNVIDATLPFIVKINRRTRSKRCSWAEENSTSRCKITGITDTCRKTCNTDI